MFSATIGTFVVQMDSTATAFCTPIVRRGSRGGDRFQSRIVRPFGIVIVSMPCVCRSNGVAKAVFVFANLLAIAI